jgi:hypothetical protein
MPHSLSGPSGFLGPFYCGVIENEAEEHALHKPTYSAYLQTTFSKRNPSSREEDRCGRPLLEWY